MYRRPNTLLCPEWRPGPGHWEIRTGSADLQLPALTVGGLLMGRGRGWRQPQLLKTGRPPEKGLLETLFTSSKFHPGQWSRHAFLNSTSKSAEVLSVSSWALPLGWAKTQVPQRPDTQIQPDGGCGWEHHSYCLSLISPPAPSVLCALGLGVS